MAVSGRTARSTADPVATLPWFAVARCARACRGANGTNGSAGLPGWPAWPAPSWAADGPGWPCGPLGAVGIDGHRTVNTVRPLSTRAVRAIRAISTSRSVRRRPIGARSAIALWGAGCASAIIVAVRGRAGPLRRASWSPRTALVVAAPVGSAVATFWAGAGTAARQLRCDSGSDRPFDELDTVRVRTLDGTGRLDRDNRDAFDAELGIGPHDVARFCPAIKKSSIQRATRVQCARGPPRPSAVGPRACELDLDAAGHRTKVQLRRRSANHGAPSRTDAILSL